MKCCIALLFALAPVFPSWAQNSPVIAGIEGVYREWQTNGDSSGARYKTADELRILRHNGSTIYFDVGLNFYNGHTCRLFGFAASENKSFVFRGNKSNYLKTCELRINISGAEISFDDVENNCRSSCGARGGYSLATFKLSKRQPFPEARKFRQSTHYKSELEAFEKDRAGGQ